MVVVSLLFAGASVAGYESFVTFQRSFSGQSELASVADLAVEAIQRGSSVGSVTLSDATIECASGNLSLSTVGFHGSDPLPAACAFGFSGLSGARTLSFIVESGDLSLQVT